MFRELNIFEEFFRIESGIGNFAEEERANLQKSVSVAAAAVLFSRSPESLKVFPIIFDDKSCKTAFSALMA